MRKFAVFLAGSIPSDSSMVRATVFAAGHASAQISAGVRAAYRSNIPSRGFEFPAWGFEFSGFVS
jgi:hypothetical protein